MASFASVVRVGVGCFVTDPITHPNKFLVGRRRGSHGAGKIALPGDLSFRFQIYFLSATSSSLIVDKFAWYSHEIYYSLNV